ncbi:hypothetical protein [Actinomycetospora lemnae]|uniref:Uncharacterized protein n=1 Tax=Actinomycetospora lemnae TaxID=3019891 RepID=A0ABT5SYW0_9PSEU|nr:hypothetical protein [Actinomycetospora sp. DW7H6]MDD7968037.1 hypothetical protein [Actinomycetospora sp. DW7H6]
MTGPAVKADAPAHIVGLWATLNAALAGAIVLYVEPLFPLPLVLHLVGAALVTIFGVAVLVAGRRGGAGPQLRLPYRSVAALAGATVALLLALTWVFGLWVLALVPYPLLVAVVMVRRERLPVDATTQAGAPGTRSPVPVPVERPLTTPEVCARALEIHHAQQRRGRGEAT